MGNVNVLVGVVLALAAGPVVAGGPAHGLDWLAGHWCSEADGRRIDAIWLPEEGGMLQGMARTMRDAEVESYAVMRIVSECGSTSLTPQPNRAPHTAYPMVARGD